MLRLAMPCMLIAALTGCGVARVGGPGAPDAAGPQVASGWTSVRVVGGDAAPASATLLERKAGGFAIAYHSDKLGDHHVYVATSVDGARWTPPASVAKANASDEHPALYEDAQGTLHCLFASNRTQHWALYEATSPDGATWSSAQALALDAQEPMNPVAAPMPDGGVAVAYESLTGPGQCVIRSASGAWSKPETVFEAGGDPAIAVKPDGSLAVGYFASRKIYVRQRGATGTWGAAAMAQDGAEEPSLAMVGGSWWLITSIEGDDGLKLAGRTSAAGGWSSPTFITSGMGDDEHPCAVALRAGGRAIAFTHSVADRSTGLYVARSAD